jgi:hypothetical protein
MLLPKVLPNETAILSMIGLELLINIYVTMSWTKFQIQFSAATHGESPSLP